MHHHHHLLQGFCAKFPKIKPAKHHQHDVLQALLGKLPKNRPARQWHLLFQGLSRKLAKARPATIATHQPRGYLQSHNTPGQPCIIIIIIVALSLFVENCRWQGQPCISSIKILLKGFLDQAIHTHQFQHHHLLLHHQSYAKCPKPQPARIISSLTKLSKDQASQPFVPRFFCKISQARQARIIGIICSQIFLKSFQTSG